MKIYRVSNLMTRKLSAMRAFLLTLPILFITPYASVADETDSLLFELAVHGPVTELALCIVKCTSLNTRRPDGVTPLLAAVQANNRATVTVLLEHGADASMADTMSFDPLYWALHKGYYPGGRNSFGAWRECRPSQFPGKLAPDVGGDAGRLRDGVLPP